MLLLTAAVCRLVRAEYKLSPGLAAWITLGGLLIIGTRHNGLFVVLPMLTILVIVAPRDAACRLLHWPACSSYCSF